ncbi:KH domain-containing protein [Patescibacteria group bacterium]
MAEKYEDLTFLEYVVKAIVGNPKDVKVDRTVDERGVLLTLHINAADMGFVIGRQGQTARSIRTLLKIIGTKNNARVNLKIEEPEGSERRPRRDDVDTSAVDDLNI